MRLPTLLSMLVGVVAIMTAFGQTSRTVVDLPKGNTAAVYLNEAGHVLIVHVSGGEVPTYESYLWIAGRLRKIGNFDGVAVNARDSVVGVTDNGTPVLWDKGQTRYLVVPTGATGVSVNSLADDGTATGVFTNSGADPISSGAWRSIVWIGGSFRTYGPPTGYSVIDICEATKNGLGAVTLRGANGESETTKAAALVDWKVKDLPLPSDTVNSQTGNVQYGKVILGTLVRRQRGEDRSYFAYWAPPYDRLPVLRTMPGGFADAMIMENPRPLEHRAVVGIYNSAPSLETSSGVIAMAPKQGAIHMLEINEKGLLVGSVALGNGTHATDDYSSYIFPIPNRHYAAVICQTDLPRLERKYLPQ